MKLALLITAVCLQGCAYTALSTATLVATDRTLTDHMASTLANADCNAVHTVSKGSYYCEQRDIGQVYNRQLRPKP